MERSSGDIIVFGVDILPGYSTKSSTRQPHYALCILVNESIQAVYEDVSLSRLIRLIWEYQPDIIAVDNVYELVRNFNELIKLTKILPPKTRIVQVTGWGSESVSIEELAYKYNIEVHGKLDPVKTAYISAFIALKGGGVTVSPVCEKTKIVITRGRNVNQGGMSSNRFKRSIRASILSVTNEIRRILDSHGLDYDLLFRKSSGGLEKSMFIVYAPRDKLYGLIKPMRNRNVRVVIKPVVNERITISEKSDMWRHRGLILGIDPGVYTGIAIMDLNGRPLYTYSSKNLDRFDILNMVSKFGEVVIVATDTHDPPDLVRKIASVLNAKLYAPPRDLSNEEKQGIINKLSEMYRDIDIRDSHVKDALASAYKAYVWIKDKLESVEAKLTELGLDSDVVERVKINIVKGKSLAEILEEEFDNIMKSTIESTDRTRSLLKPNVERDLDKYVEKIKRLNERIAYLESTIRELLSKLEEKEHVIEELKLELKLKRDISVEEFYKREINVLRNEIKSLTNEIERKNARIKELEDQIYSLKEVIVKILRGEYILIPRITVLNLSNVNRVREKTTYKLVFADEIYPLDNDAVEVLKKERIGVLTKRDHGELFKDLRIPIVEVKEYMILDDYVIVSRDVLKQVDDQWRIIDELNSEDEYQRVVKLIIEYQESRMGRRK